MNKIIITGNLTRDPVLRTTRNGINVCQFTVAINDYGANGNTVQYVNVNAWRQLGDSCAQYLKKGRKVLVEGKAHVYAWMARENNEARGAIEIEAASVEFLTPKGGDVPKTPDAEEPKEEHVEQTRIPLVDAGDDDDLPF